MLRRHMVTALLVCTLLLQPLVASAQQQQAAAPARDPNDPIERIKDEGMNRSQVMQILSYLTDVIGPRLTASPNMKRANEWTRDKLSEWGLSNAHLEAWGPFGRGWELKSFSAQVTEPQAIPLIAYPKAWSPGLKGTLTADVVYFDATDEAGLEKFKGKLKGAIVLTSRSVEFKPNFEPMGRRRDEKDLLRLADAAAPGSGPRRPAFQLTPQQRTEGQFAARKQQFFVEEGAALLVDPSRRGDGGTLFVQSATVAQPFVENPFGPAAPGAPRRFSPWDKDAPRIVPQMVMAGEHYNRLIRMLQAGEKVKMSVNLAVEYQDKDLMGYNTIAEIPGTDPNLKDEVVMLGGHMDSWHAGTGATDNGAGVATAMEAVRILQALKLQPRRTIRVALWSGEEQGLYGSRYYVMQHFATLGNGTIEEMRFTGLSQGAPVKVNVKPDYEKLAGYFNLDNGTGKIRGIYLQGNEALRPLFRQWLMPFREMGASTISISNTGGTDHLAFDAVNLPGFQFIQDEIEYETRTHHSNQDVFDRIVGDDMKQNAVIMAAFVYNTAMADERLQHKPLPANVTSNPASTSRAAGAGSN